MTQRYAGTRLEREGLWDWNLVTNRIHFSPRWLSLVGCDEHEIGHGPDSWLTRIHPEDRDRVVHELEIVRSDGRAELDMPHRLRHRNGTYRWMSCRALVERNQAGRAIRLTGWHTDVTAEEVTDPVTGLPNHKLLIDRLTLAIDRTHHQASFQFALLLIDLGRSPDITERATPPIDARLLTTAARRLETCLRSADRDLGIPHSDLVARRHGDQFAVLLEGLDDVGHAKVIGDRVLGELLAPFSQGGDQVFVPASIGIAVSVTAYRSADDMIRDAETALHRARMLGGSKCELFDTAVLRSEEAQAGLDIALRTALEQGEFRLFYQPIMSLASNQIIGFEALVRWQHPVRGLISPQEFIPLAEKTGFIVPLGRWILREACNQLKSWQDTLSADCWLSVNLSAVQLKHPTLVEEISDALGDSGLEARQLTLELTESMAMENPIAVKTLLMRLRALGVRISIDDFGTGYSSLAHLRQFPVDTLKVDRSFIRGIETDSDTSAIIAALIALSQQLGLHVVVEGVENEGQLTLLRSLRCDAVQGYLFATPLDADGVANLLTTGLTLPPEATSGQPVRRARLFGGVLSASAKWAAAAAAVLMTAGVAWISLGPKTASPAVLGPTTASPAADAPAPETPRASPSGAESKPLKGPSQTRSAASPMPVPASLNVIHLHKMGSCAGSLLISRDGIKYTPEKHAKDAFTLPHGEFVQSMADDTLTVRSASKTYRFKSAAAGKNDNGSQLRTFAASIARFKPISTAF